jgi:two-component system CheB/CheR fusion protein
MSEISCLSRDSTSVREPTHLVGIGASAGGLEALERFFRSIPADTGMAFAVVQHLSPDFKSLMDELLARFTKMPIHRVEDGMAVQANSIYLMPPKMEMTVEGHRLHLECKHPSEGLSLPIDTFFKSLAEAWGLQAVAIILSGTGSDGSRGIRHIHEAGGLVLTQSSESAKFDGMPRSGENTGVVDLVQSPEELAATIARYATFPIGNKGGLLDKPVVVDEDSMNRLLRLLREEFEVDFTDYKPGTVLRRIERRVLLSGSTDFDAYVDCIANDHDELNSLYKDLLIGVTSFFRDPDAFSHLERHVIPELLSRIQPGDQFRAWVAGCATGEEAYSLAILLFEQLEDLQLPLDVKIFATDIHRTSLDHASSGLYAEAQLAELSVERKRRFFVKTARGFQLIPELRQMIVFAPHNVATDAPFTRLDLVTCRNMLIYLKNDVQARVLSLFHFALKKHGVLFLGPSETLGDVASEFDTLDMHWKLYRKRREVRLTREIRLPGVGDPSTSRISLRPPPYSPATSSHHDGALAHAYDRLLTRYMPVGVLLDDRRELVHVFGDVSPYVQLRPGRPSRDAVEMFAPGIRAAANGAIHRALRDLEPVHYSGVRLSDERDAPFVRLQAEPIVGKDGELTHLMVTIEPVEVHDTAPSTELDADAVSRDRMEVLEGELRTTRENLQATIEELETSNEELQATNEELVASNEELQSTNEELHSVNEELYTVNAEYQKKITELTELTDDMNHLFEHMVSGVLFLDRDLTIRKFTKSIAPIFNLVPHDIGRAFSSFSNSLQLQGLVNDIHAVIDGQIQFEKEVCDSDGHWYVMRIQPYQSRGRIDGAVVELFDVTDVKKNRGQLRREIQRLKSVLDQAVSLVCVKDLEGKYLFMNRRFAEVVGCDRSDLIKKCDHEIMEAKFADALQALDLLAVKSGQTVSVDPPVPLGKDAILYRGVKFPIRGDAGRIEAVGTRLTPANWEPESASGMNPSEA